MSDSSPQQLWSQIVRYSSVANGTALVLALSTLGKTPVVQVGAPVGKFPIWCFFFGLMASGLHLLVRYVFLAENAREAANDQLSKLERRLNKIRNDALAAGEWSAAIATAAADLDRLKSDMDGLNQGQPAGLYGSLRNLQEALLWGSYGLFLLGAGVVVWSI